MSKGRRPTGPIEPAPPRCEAELPHPAAYYYHVPIGAEGAHEGAMRYRYRTSCLLGGWKDTAEEACKDAIRARQAMRAEDGTMAWVGNAGLEAASIRQAARRIS